LSNGAMPLSSLHFFVPVTKQRFPNIIYAHEQRRSVSSSSPAAAPRPAAPQPMTVNMSPQPQPTPVISRPRRADSLEHAYYSDELPTERRGSPHFPSPETSGTEPDFRGSSP
jgi:hypothetical protein